MFILLECATTPKKGPNMQVVEIKLNHIVDDNIIVLYFIEYITPD